MRINWKFHFTTFNKLQDKPQDVYELIQISKPKKFLVRLVSVVRQYKKVKGSSEYGEQEDQIVLSCYDNRFNVEYDVGKYVASNGSGFDTNGSFADD